jgi:hypothetical protein
MPGPAVQRDDSHPRGQAWRAIAPTAGVWRGWRRPCLSRQFLAQTQPAPCADRQGGFEITTLAFAAITEADIRAIHKRHPRAFGNPLVTALKIGRWVFILLYLAWSCTCSKWENC